MQGRDVDRQLQRRPSAPVPLCCLPTSLLQHPGPHGHDEAAFLRDRDEVLRLAEAVPGPSPAQQCLDPDHRTAAQSDLGLVVQLELLALQGEVQGIAGADTGQHPGVHVRMEHPEAVLARPLGFVERGVGVPHQGVGRVRVGRVERCADRERDEEPLAVEVEGSGELRADRLATLFQGQDAVYFRQDGDEFVARQPAGAVLGTEAVPQSVRYALQQQVAGGMAVRVVDELELVEVHAQQTGCATTAPGGVQGLVQQVLSAHTVRQAGQRVVECQVFGLLAPCLLARQVDMGIHQQHTHHDQFGEMHRPSIAADPDGQSHHRAREHKGHLDRAGARAVWQRCAPCGERPDQKDQFTQRIDPLAQQHRLVHEQGAERGQQGHGVDSTEHPGPESASANVQQGPCRQREHQVAQGHGDREDRHEVSDRPRQEVRYPLTVERR